MKTHLAPLLFSWKGRIGRKPYIIIQASLLFISLLVFLLLRFPTTAFFIISLPVIVTTAISLILIYIEIILTVKRLHDLNLSGWLVLIFAIFVVTTIGILLNLEMEISAEYISNFLWPLAILLLAIPKGTKGANQFGPDPAH